MEAGIPAMSAQDWMWDGILFPADEPVLGLAIVLQLMNTLFAELRPQIN